MPVRAIRFISPALDLRPADVISVCCINEPFLTFASVGRFVSSWQTLVPEVALRDGQKVSLMSLLRFAARPFKSDNKSVMVKING